jgi:hypothetical protein
MVRSSPGTGMGSCGGYAMYEGKTCVITCQTGYRKLGNYYICAVTTDPTWPEIVGDQHCEKIV